MISSLALVVVIVVDQLRTDQLFRAQKNFNPAGISKFIKHGIFYDDAHHSNFVNMTCPGHVTISTGADSGLHGIMLNEDFDRKTDKAIYCLEDKSEHWIDAGADAETAF